MTHTIIKEVISRELAEFIYQYFLNKRKVAKHLLDTKYIPHFTESWGTWGDQQVPGTYFHYGDIVMDTLLEKVKPLVEKETSLKLNETYSYARIYKKGDVLPRHKDRYSCEISASVNLGGDEWPLYLEPSGEINKEGIQIIMHPGDMLIYRGCDLEHWREAFEGENYGQVFLHYNDASQKDAEKNKYDTRPFLGLPVEFKGKH